MIKYFKCVCLLICVFYVCSCGDSSNAIGNSAKFSRMRDYKAFLVLNNGDTIKGIKWNLKRNENLVIDGKKFKDSMVKSFQSPYGLATRYRSAVSAHSFIDQWAYYLVRGKINMFSVQKFMGMSSSYDSKAKMWTSNPRYLSEFYYNLNSVDSFFTLNSQKVRELIDDCPQSVIEFNKSELSDKSYLWAKKTIKILEVYNKYSESRL